MNQFLLSPDIFRNLYSNIRASVEKWKDKEIKLVMDIVW